MPLTLQAVSTPNKSLIGTNCIYAAAGDLSALGVQDGGFIQVKSMVFTVHADVGVEAGALAFNLVQRKSLQLSLNEPLSVAPWFPPRENVFVCKLRVEADFPNKARATTNPVDAEQLGKYAAKIFQQQCVSVSQDILNSQFRMFTNSRYRVWGRKRGQKRSKTMRAEGGRPV